MQNYIGVKSFQHRVKSFQHLVFSSVAFSSGLEATASTKKDSYRTEKLFFQLFKVSERKQPGTWKNREIFETKISKNNVLKSKYIKCHAAKYSR